MGNSNSMGNYSVVAPNTKFVLKLKNNCKCQGCLMKVKKLLQKIHGIHSTSIDANTWQVTIWGTVDPQEVIWVLKRKNIKADLLLVEIPSMKKKQEMQMKTLPLPVDQEFHGQNLVAEVRIADNEGGLNEFEITLKAKFDRKNKDGMSLERDTHKNIAVADNHDRGPISQGLVYNSYYEAGDGGPPLTPPETPWHGNYFPPPKPVAGYEPSAPPRLWEYVYPYFWSSG